MAQWAHFKNTIDQNTMLWEWVNRWVFLFWLVSHSTSIKLLFRFKFLQIQSQRFVRDHYACMTAPPLHYLINCHGFELATSRPHIAGNSKLWILTIHTFSVKMSRMVPAAGTWKGFLSQRRLFGRRLPRLIPAPGRASTCSSVAGLCYIAFEKVRESPTFHLFFNLLVSKFIGWTLISSILV